MAFFLTPRFAPAYQCSPYSDYCAPSRPVYRQSRPSFPSFVPFLAQVDELLSEIDREARREAQREAQRAAHLARLQRKRAYRQRFNVEENKEGWEVQAEIPGFEQENVAIEVTDEQTLKISGNTERKNEHAQAEAVAAPVEAVPAAETEAEKAAEAQNTEDMDGVTITEADAVASDTESHKSYQATVEDDFEDLGAETSSTVSATEAPKEPKGKEKVVDEPAATTVAPQQQPEAPAQQQQEAEEKFQGAFERTFKFPVRIDAGSVRASFKEGVLRISVPRAPVQQIRQITIQ